MDEFKTECRCVVKDEGGLEVKLATGLQKVKF